MKKLDIIIVAYNRPNELKTIINCFKSQTNQNFKVTIIHDGPNDQLYKELLNENYLTDQYKFITTENRANEFGHNLRDLGLKKYVDLEWVLLTNDDNYYCPVFVDKVLKEINYYDVICFNMIHSHQNYSPFKSEFKYCGIDIGSFIVKSEIAKKVGFNHRDFCADGRFVEEIKNFYPNLKIKYLPEYLFIHN